MNTERNYLKGLNEKQREAVLHGEGPLLILAGAGSGKTSTMTRRLAHLILEQNVPPYKILAVTFTNKAAGEMRERVEQIMGGNVETWISTFHSACLRILRKHADLLGYTKSFVVYDAADQQTLMKKIMKEENLADEKLKPRDVLAAISKAKESKIYPKNYSMSFGGGFRNDIIENLYTEYLSALKKNNAMDFDDLLLKTVELLEDHEDVLDYYQKKFEYIMVDEYQDTNRLQYEFVKMLTAPENNICVVGDDDQCIYEWRGANIANILNFEKDFKGTKVIKLEQNYRSKGNILAAAHSVIENNRKRKKKKLWTEAAEGNKLIYRRCDDDRDEALFIAHEIELLKGQYSGYKDFAVLYRMNSLSRNFEKVFSTRGIPYRVVGGLRYYDRKEIKDIMSYLRLLANPKDDIAFLRVINEPKRGIGKTTMEKLGGFANFNGTSLFEAASDKNIADNFSGKAAVSMTSFCNLIKRYAGERENLRLIDLYDGILKDSGYMTALEESKNLENESRIDNLLEFRSVIIEATKDGEITLEQFLEDMALMADIDNKDTDEDAVTLMTLHSAKGLEFPVVFMNAMEDGIFPGFNATDRLDGLEEERRLCYVGMTRAKERLFLTGAAARMIYGSTEFTRESQFLREVEPRLIEGDSIMRKTNEIKVGESTSLDGYAKENAFKPFSKLQAAKAEMKQKKKEVITDSLLQGDRVNHKKFGEGLVIEVSGNIATVAFDGAGIKKLAVDMAPMKKL